MILYSQHLPVYRKETERFEAITSEVGILLESLTGRHRSTDVGRFIIPVEVPIQDFLRDIAVPRMKSRGGGQVRADCT
jgi:hypothetical protein